MWHTQRRARILSILREAENARTASIAAELGVSRETIRRDLLAMEEEGLLERVHGGAVTATMQSEETFQTRKTLNWAEKHEIGRKAVSLLAPGMIVFVDVGTTTLAFAKALRDGPDIQVVTNSIDIAQLLKPKCILLGGRVTSDVPGTFGELTFSEIGRFMADIAILSPTAVHPRQGVMYYELQEAEIARAMRANARQAAILADGSKLGKTSRVVMDDLERIDHLVVDSKVSDAQRAQFVGLVPHIL